MIHEKWMEPIHPMIAKWITPEDLQLLSDFNQTLNELSQDTTTSSILCIKKKLASQGYSMLDINSEFGGKGRSPILQALVQFICGYHGLDYRDVAHAGHGRMILLHGSLYQRAIWIPKICQGHLIAIAATEAQSGSQIQNIKTFAKEEGNRLLLSGTKSWISRLEEASLMVCFFRFTNDGSISAALIEPNRPGVTIQNTKPSGLDGWSWGRVFFDNVHLTDQDILGSRENGLNIFKEHFMYYRPMVAMTALGAAASVLDKLLKHINVRVSEREIQQPRDSTLESIATHYAGINAGILLALCATIQHSENTSYSSLWSRIGKAWSVDHAYKAVSDLSIFMGASSFQHNSFNAKALRDLRGLLFADGIHDALMRSAGRTLITLEQ